MYSLLVTLCFSALGADPQPISAPPPSQTWGHASAWIGTAIEAARPDAATSPSDLVDTPVSLDLSMRMVTTGPLLLGSGTTQRLRMARDGQGRTLIEEASLQTRIFGLGIRPAAGDLLEVTFLGGRWEQNVFGLARPWTQLQVYVPVRAVPIGFSDTDVDEARALRYFVAGGAGIGADWWVRAAGPVGFRLRGEGGAETLRRFRRDAAAQARHEAWGRAELDLTLHNGGVGLTLGAYADYRAQWDALVGTGVTRSIVAGGLRVGVRVPSRSRAPEPGIGPGPAHKRTNRRNQSTRAREEPAEYPPPPLPELPSPDEHETLNLENALGVDR